MDQSLATMLWQNQFYSIGPWSGKKNKGCSFFLQKFGRILLHISRQVKGDGCKGTRDGDGGDDSGDNGDGDGGDDGEGGFNFVDNNYRFRRLKRPLKVTRAGGRFIPKILFSDFRFRFWPI